MFSEYMIICIFYILGIVISKMFDMSATLFISLFVFFVAVILSVIKRKVKWSVFVLTFVLLFGSFRYFDETQSKLVYEFPEKYVTVSGVIYSSAVTTETEYKNRYVLKLDSVAYQDKAVKTNQKILLNTKEDFHFGTKVVASGFLSELEEVDNENEFDFSLYYKGKGILARLTAQDIRQTGMAFSLLPEFLAGKACDLSDSIIDTHFDGVNSAFLKAIVTGNKGEFSRDYLDILIKTGIYRTLYTPFIHISLIILLVGLLPFGRKHRDSLIIVLVFLYALFNSTSPTIIKAAMLCAFLLLRKQIFGFANKLDMLSKIVLAITVIDPLLCFNSGFVLSVASTVLVCLSYTPLYERLYHFFDKHNIPCKRLFAKLFTLWVIFVFGTLPISAYMVGSVSVYATLFMTLLTPAIIFVLIASPFMLLSLGIFGASPVLFPIIDKIMTVMTKLPYLAEKLPAYYITARTPELWEIIGFYLLWWVFLRILKFKFKTPKTAVILTVALGIMFSSLFTYDYNTLFIYFVNVGQGDGAVLHTSRGETVLIDGGGSADYTSSYNIGERVYLPYLTSHGFCDIDVAIVSHTHKDHVEGIIAAAENLNIKTIVMPYAVQENQYRKELCEVAENRGIKIEYLSATDEIIFKSGLKITFIAPDNSQLSSDDLNDTSLVAHVIYGDFSALFTGDSSDDVSEAYPEDVDLLKVAHHGSKTASSKEYLEHTSPEYAVISVGENNSYNHPSTEVLYRLKSSGAKVLRTDKSGDIRFKIKKDGTFTYKTLKGE